MNVIDTDEKRWGEFQRELEQDYLLDAGTVGGV
jgi:hypothetical protein